MWQEFVREVGTFIMFWYQFFPGCCTLKIIKNKLILHGIIKKNETEDKGGHFRHIVHAWPFILKKRQKLSKITDTIMRLAERVIKQLIAHEI